MAFLASHSSIVYGFCKAFKNLMVTFCDFLFLFLDPGPCISWISVALIVLNVDFLPSSFYELWELVLEKSPMNWESRGSELLQPLCFSYLVLISYWNGQLLALFSWCPQLHLSSFQGKHLGQFGILWSARYQCFFLLSLTSWYYVDLRIIGDVSPPTCILGFLVIPYQLVCLKILSMSF